MKVVLLAGGFGTRTSDLYRDRCPRRKADGAAGFSGGIGSGLRLCAGGGGRVKGPAAQGA